MKTCGNNTKVTDAVMRTYRANEAWWKILGCYLIMHKTYPSMSNNHNHGGAWASDMN